MRGFIDGGGSPVFLCSNQHWHADPEQASDCELFTNKPDKWVQKQRAAGRTVVFVDGKPSGVLFDSLPQ